jgi:hypothetical protein
MLSLEVNVDVTVSIRFSCVLLLVMRIACLLYSLKSCQQAEVEVEGPKNKKTQNMFG